MRLIKNHDAGPSSTHRQNPRQEVSTVNTIPPDAELDELFCFHDDPDFLVGSAQGRAELRRLVLSSPMLKGGGSAAGSGTASTVETSGVETTESAIPPTHLRHLALSRPWVRRTLAGTAAALAAITCAIGISLSNTSQDAVQTRPPDARPAMIPVAGSANPQAMPPSDSTLSHSAVSPATVIIPPQVQVTTSFSTRFAANSTTLTPDEEANILHLVTKIHSFLIYYPNGRVTVTGYTANALDGTPVEQREIALARARTVASLLATTGIPAERMIVAAGSTDLSSTQNVGFNEDLDNQMRRVDITLQP